MVRIRTLHCLLRRPALLSKTKDSADGETSLSSDANPACFPQWCLDLKKNLASDMR